ncbi:TetR/AcrR family transcriptional regulator [Pseudonocardia alni]|uniref:TetR family transcriptional regulator n=1 Tax=Pseudonocardia alni TaxID=33907 RepID=A0AA44UQY2_PSEA5|nr:TetR/AcrR family transcriptional regulator [Pseudonocardia alni]PKB31875.1 TetR family transcriptional regulator [Pseudonocardia alni]
MVSPVDEPRPPRPRRTQGERRASSRAIILAAALEELFENGYAHSTTVTVQRRAGVSRGRLLHHFPSRESLLIAAAQHLVVEQIADMEQWVLGSEYGRTTGPERCDRAVELLWGTFAQPYFWASMELWVAARTSTDIRNELFPAERRLGVAVTHVVATMFGPVLSSHPDFDECRDLLFTSMRGVAMTYAIHPRDPVTEPHLPSWKRLARRMLDIDDADRTTGTDG